MTDRPSEVLVPESGPCVAPHHHWQYVRPSIRLVDRPVGGGARTISSPETVGDLYVCAYCLRAIVLPFILEASAPIARVSPDETGSPKEL